MKNRPEISGLPWSERSENPNVKIVLKWQDFLSKENFDNAVPDICSISEEIGDGMEYMELLKIVIPLYVKFYTI